jgi:hypothetical protein
METMQTGYDSGDKPLLNVCAYVSFQELATRVSHRNTGKFTDEPIAEKLLTRVAKDENLHMIFYRNIVQAALELAPSQTMRAITDEVVDFKMPGSIIPGFGRKAVQMAMAGIYDLRIHHDDIVAPLLRQWGVWELEGLDAEDKVTVRALIEKHIHLTGSTHAQGILDNFEREQKHFIKVMPTDYKRVLSEKKQRHQVTVKELRLAAV